MNRACYTDSTGLRIGGKRGGTTAGASGFRLRLLNFVTKL